LPFLPHHATAFGGHETCER